MIANLRRGHEALWAKFFCPENNLIYDAEIVDHALLPTPEEVARSIPSCAGWGTGMEDCCLTAGFVLGGLVVAHRLTGEGEWAEKARKVFNGLVALGTVSGVPGFVARGFAPGRTDVYPNSSADQYTAYVYGLWNYARSRIADVAERRTAARLLVEVARRVEAFGDDIPTLDGRPSIYGDTSTIEPGRACRILQFYRAAYDLSGDPHWHERYMQKVEEQGRARVRCHYGPEEWPMPRNTHAVVQSQAAFRLLYDSEEDGDLRAAYRDALRAEALAVIHRIPMWREIVSRPLGKAYPPRWRSRWQRFFREHPDYDPSRPEQVNLWHRWSREHAAEFPPTPEEEAQARPSLPWLRHQTQSLAVVMMCEDMDLKRRAAEDALPMLREVDWTLVTDARVWESLDLGYWLGVEAGVFPRE